MILNKGYRFSRKTVRAGSGIFLLFFVLPLIFMTGCFSRTAMMTRENYDTIAIGTPITELQKQIGTPSSVRSKGDDLEEYEYIERITMNGNYTIENNYYLEILNGIIVGKRMTSERTPAYNFMYNSDPNFAPDVSPP
jgi:hypothetical protein